LGGEGLRRRLGELVQQSYRILDRSKC
jgi:hypothetical protein